MARGIYVSAMTPGSGKSLISLGLADMLGRHADRVGFFRPIVEGDNPAQDPMVELMQRRFNLGPATCRGGLTRTQLRALLVAGERGEVDARCLAVYSEIAANCDVVIVEGTDLSGHDVALEFDLNARLANDLGTVVLAVVNAQETTAAETADAVDVARRQLADAKCDLLAVMVNRAAPSDVEAITAAIRPGQSGRPVYVIPEQSEISQPSIAEVQTALRARQVAGSANLERDVSAVKVAAMTVGNFIPQLSDGTLVIVPADRADVMVATLASSFSSDFPVASGMILTGGIDVEPAILGLLASAPFPVFEVETDTYITARRVSRVRGEISSGNRRKVAAALGTWSRHVDEAELLERLALPRPATTTPLRFLNELIVRARTSRQRIVLPEGLDLRVLQAAEILSRRDVCALTVLGPEGQIRELAASEGIDLSNINLINPATSALREEFAREYATLRKHKGVSLEDANERMLHGAYFGTMMVQLGRVDGMVSGAAHTTANTIRPALEFIRTREGVKIVSSVFLMLLEDRVLVYGDCAVNPDPDAEQLADIALASAATAEQFGVTPRVAMLSYATGSSGKGGSVERVRQATELVRRARPDLPVEGPIQYDAAVDASVAASKAPGSSVAGQATVFIFPDLNTGNNTYKAVQQSAGAVAVGPILQGLRKPVNDLSRGCTVEDIVNTVAITAVQAQED
ncbi:MULTISPECIES: phosphate acetyltransferase [unclassified Arthrobacter]|uniref:phosphate acetyltransferase n=1 Tax=unclassified Arthrobacter TaxID=235627 RepID=UPI002106AF87|nr:MULTISPECIES: phosphate acetyltransferase [unclassified Arthrobacter]MCQ1946454.1 phosphate acetyltransferase [Arthrobacter sp. zg-Y1116]MCQ1986394.1 phosphate acetyltransferase [Arthrobacter sp. zg-Y844]MCQ1993866.1 phosphate acetyltransferase [Arthrobacter sp. zg-Y1171]UWX82010.1 phosphate acetyltransferase [Arthrobacter sp. zg-Y1171]